MNGKKIWESDNSLQEMWENWRNNKNIWAILLPPML